MYQSIHPLDRAWFRIYRGCPCGDRSLAHLPTLPLPSIQAHHTIHQLSAHSIAGKVVNRILRTRPAGDCKTHTTNTCRILSPLRTRTRTPPVSIRTLFCSPPLIASHPDWASSLICPILASVMSCHFFSFSFRFLWARRVSIGFWQPVSFSFSHPSVFRSVLPPFFVL